MTALTPAERGIQLAQAAPPITREQATAAARILLARPVTPRARAA